MTLLALLLCSLIGVSLGLLGGGGSILAVPLLVAVARVPPREAVGMSLAVVGATSLFAAVLHARAGNVDLRAAALFSLFGAGGAFGGARLSRGVSPEILLLLFSFVMVTAGLAMLRPRGAGVARTGRGQAWHRLAPVGIGLGLLTGFLGVGGGFLAVPALVLFGGLAMPAAVGTSLVVIAVNSAAGFLGTLGSGSLDLPLMAAFVVTAVAGAFAGQRLSSRVDPRTLRFWFGLLVVLLGIVFLGRSLLALR